MDPILIFVWVFGIVGFVSTLFVDAPYGKFSKTGFLSNWIPKINGIIGFCIQELPSLIVFLYFYVSKVHTLDWYHVIGGCLFAIHYFHRAILYTVFRVTSMSDTNFMVVSMAFTFTSCNGLLQARYLDSSRNTPILSILGFILFWVGFWINYKCDEILIHLRKEKKTKYLIPYGNMFEYVSCANYFGESIEWLGFALYLNNIAAWTFLLFTLSNLVPRAIAQHRWYRDYFKEEYPRDRKAIIPFLV